MPYNQWYMHGRLSLSLAYLKLYLVSARWIITSRIETRTGVSCNARRCNGYSEPAGDVVGGVQATTGSSTTTVLTAPRRQHDEWFGRTTAMGYFTILPLTPRGFMHWSPGQGSNTRAELDFP